MSIAPDSHVEELQCAKIERLPLRMSRPSAASAIYPSSTQRMTLNCIGMSEYIVYLPLLNFVVESRDGSTG